tara:strand:- start:524 stop:1063 length:540 start_codon:yes stop_codon:yes gene_type:complete
MEYSNSNQINGLPKYAFYGQEDRVEELNKRLGSRHNIEKPLEPNFNLRPTSTKYDIFPILDKQPVPSTKKDYETYKLSNQFFNGNSRAPPSGYFSNVDLESNLRNQQFALQKGANQSVYVPTSESDMYKIKIPYSPSEQPHPKLFTQPQFSKDLHDNVKNDKIGNDKFFNHTRTQLRDL